jgi:hypothetical protein
MRKALFILCLIAISYPVGASALIGISIGGKVGYSDYSGDIFAGSGDLGNGTAYGVILGFGAVPVVNFQLRASYFAKDVELAYEYMGQTLEAAFEFRDVAMTALLTKSIFAPTGSPINLYLGGGVGYHFMNTEVALAAAEGTLSTTDPLSAVQNVGKMSLEGLAGLKLGAPAFPLSAFGEVGYGMIFTTERFSVTQVSAGVMLSF